MIKIKFFTIAPPKNQTNLDDTLTCYEIKEFLNTNKIQPIDISAEYNELSGNILISLAYREEKNFWTSIHDFFKNHNSYQIRFVELAEYKENSHTYYIQLPLENAINDSDKNNISHAIYVEHGMVKVIFLEYSEQRLIY